jgi:hypothetical protein
MEPFHGSFSGDALRSSGAGLRDVDETKSAGLVFAAIISDLRLTQGTGSVEIHGRFRKLWLHADLLEYPTVS